MRRKEQTMVRCRDCGKESKLKPSPNVTKEVKCKCGSGNVELM